MKLRHSARTDVGKTRDHNEDSYGVGEGQQAEEMGELLVVCDGMGGHAAGEVASELAVATILASYYGDTSEDRQQALEQAFEPIVAPIEFDVDVDARRGRVRVKDVLSMDGQPIRNPVTGAEHRVRIDLPGGFEYELAEIGSGTSRTTGNVAIELKDSYAQFARLHLNNHGVIRHRTAA